MENLKMMKEFRTLGKIQYAVSRSETLDEALKNGLTEIMSGLNVEFSVIWYYDKNGDRNLHPYYWIAPFDFTQKQHIPGKEIVGNVFSSQQSARILDYQNHRDPRTDSDFAGIEIASMVCVPFSDEYENLGCIQFINSVGREMITEEQADVCEMLSLFAALSISENPKIADFGWKSREPILRATDIVKEFHNGDVLTKVLKGVNLDIYKGEFLVILGESGCGKTTLLNILGGLERATSGKLTFHEEEISAYTQEQLTQYRRDHIGFIFQSYNLMPNLTAKQNLDLIAELVEGPMDSMEALRMVGLGEKSGNYPSQLSGGQQQRVSIARALVKKPELIFADEPTAALDYATSIEVLEVLENIRKTGTTLVMVTHNNEIARMADRVVRMRNGRTYEITVNKHPVDAGELIW